MKVRKGILVLLALMVIGAGIYTTFSVEATTVRQVPITFPICSSNADCATNEFCEVPPGQCGGTGHCVETPSLCSAIYIPVCGCDQFTYSNDCYRAMAQISRDHQGPC